MEILRLYGLRVEVAANDNGDHQMKLLHLVVAKWNKVTDLHTGLQPWSRIVLSLTPIGKLLRSVGHLPETWHSQTGDDIPHRIEGRTGPHDHASVCRVPNRDDQDIGTSL